MGNRGTVSHPEEFNHFPGLKMAHIDQVKCKFRFQHFTTSRQDSAINKPASAHIRKSGKNSSFRNIFFMGNGMDQCTLQDLRRTLSGSFAFFFNVLAGFFILGQSLPTDGTGHRNDIEDIHLITDDGHEPITVFLDSAFFDHFRFSLDSRVRILFDSFFFLEFFVPQGFGQTLHFLFKLEEVIKSSLFHPHHPS